jgi:hypothetical protein
VIICADDFGLSDDVDDAIAELCTKGRLSAVSCLVALERCGLAQCQSLRRHEQDVDLGLHLCLTREESTIESGLRTPAANLPALFMGVLSRASTSADWKREIGRQYGLFVEKFGRPPDYIDGHLHVHQLPVVRTGLFEFLSELPPGRPLYVRNTASRARELISAGLPWRKATAVGWLGAKLRDRLAAAGIDTNRGFYGVYDFARSRRYPDYLPGFLACAREANSLLVVHPGRVEAWRRQEFECLQTFKLPPGGIHRFRRDGAARPISGAGS